MQGQQDTFWQIHNLISSGGEVKKEEKKELEKIDEEHCPICDNDYCVKYNGENNVCTKCGSLIDSNISHGQECRWYGAADSKSINPTRVGMPTNKLLPNASMGSTIGRTQNNSFEMNRIKQKQRWIGMDYRSRSLLQIFSVITSKAQQGGITNKIIENAKSLYKKISETKISRGMNRKALEAACLFESCKIHGVHRSPKEIAELYGLETKIMTKGYKKFKSILKLSENTTKKTKSHFVKAAIPIDYIDRFCCNLKVTEKVKDLCMYAAKVAYEKNIADKNTPTSIAAGSIFLISMLYNLNITKKEIKDASGGVSEVTISKCFKKLYKCRHLLVENWPNLKNID